MLDDDNDDVFCYAVSDVTEDGGGWDCGAFLTQRSIRNILEILCKIAQKKIDIHPKHRWNISY